MNSINNNTLKTSMRVLNKQKAITAIILIFAIMPFVNPLFFSAYNMTDMLKSASVLATIGCGVTVVIVCGAFDLSLGGTMCLSGIVLIKMMGVYPMWICFAAAIGVGIVVGFINGFLVVHQRTEPFVITLGMGALLKGLAQQFTDAHPISGSNEAFLEFGTGKLFGIPYISLVMLGVLLITFCVLRFTQFGRNCYAIGGDYDVAVHSGINALRTKWITFVIAGFAAALGGILLSARLNSAASTHGDMTALMVNCGAVLGGTSFAGGIGGAGQTFLGIILFSVLESALGMSGLNAYMQEVITGIVIVAIIGLDAYAIKRKAEAV